MEIFGIVERGADGALSRVAKKHEKEEGENSPLAIILYSDKKANK